MYALMKWTGEELLRFFVDIPFVPAYCVLGEGRVRQRSCCTVSYCYHRDRGTLSLQMRIFRSENSKMQEGLLSPGSAKDALKGFILTPCHLVDTYCCR